MTILRWGQGAASWTGGAAILKSLFAAVLVAAATPAIAGYSYTTIDAAGPGVLGTVVTAINDNRVATGYYVTYDPSVPPGALGSYTAFTVNADGSGFTSFTRPGYAQTGAAGINNAGDITGVSLTAGNVGTGFVRSGFDGSYIDIDPNLGGIFSVYSEAIGINNSGWVTGFYATDPTATVATLEQYAHGFVTDGTDYFTVDVDPSLGFGTRVISINDAGIITGTYLDNTPDHFRHPFVGFGPGALISLAPDPFGAPSAEIGNLTLSGYATYNALYPTPLSPIGYASAAFVLDFYCGCVADIVAAPGSLFTEVFGINEATDITGLYFAPDGLHGFIATYVPEPAIWALMILGFGLTGVTLRRRVAAKG